MTENAAAPTDLLIEKLLSGDRLALARAITAVENEGAEGAAIMRGIRGHLGHALTVGFTGPPGAGKSTLVNAFVQQQRARGRTVGVIAVDPSSPITGGAILGDRIRMTGHSNDMDVFVRSLASRGHLGGLSRTAVKVLDVMDAAKKDVIVIETVGAGQSEVEIAGVADVKIVVAAPGLGDDVQAIKAGILEIADILVVNKGDHPLASQTVRHLRTMTGFRTDGDDVPVLRTTALTGEGLDRLAYTVAELGERGRADAPVKRLKLLLGRVAMDICERKLQTGDPALTDALADAVATGDADLDQAAEKLLMAVLERLK